jgi:ribonuclease R
MIEIDKSREFAPKEKRKPKKKKTNLVTGTLTLNAKGFGFVTVEGFPDDIFIPAKYVGNAFQSDIVEVEVAEKSGRRGPKTEGKIVRIVERGIKEIVGTFEQVRRDYGFVIPDRIKLPRDIFIPSGRSMGAVNGHKVVVRITDYGEEHRSPEGEIIEILGHINDPGVDILSIVRAFGLPEGFPEEVLREAAEVAAKEIEPKTWRTDLRDELMITIDGDDAKDLDDAVSLTYDGEFFHLGVHIADVSEYVKEGSLLDVEAYRRGTSVYLVDRVIPMLPHALSNGSCSLNQKEDRYAMSCLMTINGSGEIVDHEICESIIRVDRRMSYTEVHKMLQDPSVCDAGQKLEDAAFVLDMIQQMAGVASILRNKRRRRGSIDFDLPECKILLDPQGRPLEIHPYEHTEANDLIEDFMLAANETVAEHFYWLDAPFVYRIHDVPDQEKIQNLMQLIGAFGYHVKGSGKGKTGKKSKVNPEEVHPKEIQKLLAQIAGTPEEGLITRLALRSMKQAKYSPDCTGHFGLAASYYCHFTSPIRRYPDLQIHRIIKEYLRGELNEARRDHYREILEGVAHQSSRLERRAAEAERETDKLKKVQYMTEHIGEEYDGIISGVTKWGVYVELESTVEGMIRMQDLPFDTYLYDETTGELFGSRTGRTFRMGNPIRIQVAAADLFNRTIDFIVAVDDN